MTIVSGDQDSIYLPRPVEFDRRIDPILQNRRELAAAIDTRAKDDCDPRPRPLSGIQVPEISDNTVVVAMHPEMNEEEAGDGDQE
jgi:hypothetical protein